MPDPQRHDEVLLRRLDDLELEVVRHQFLLDRDERFELVLRLLVVRAVPTIERVCRERGAALGLNRSKVGLAIEDASARLLLRLSRPDELPPVGAIAAQIAALCADAQRPQLDGRPVPLNDWRTS
jgi:hypothetical protein